jgi:hypothetical protein
MLLTLDLRGYASFEEYGDGVLLLTKFLPAFRADARRW